MVAENSTYDREYQTTNLVNPVISAGKVFHKENNTSTILEKSKNQRIYSKQPIKKV